MNKLSPKEPAQDSLIEIELPDLDKYPNVTEQSIRSVSNQLSLVHEAEYEDSKQDSNCLQEEKKSPFNKEIQKSSSKSLSQSQILGASKRSEKSSEAYMDYNFEKTSEKKQTEQPEEFPKENHSHFSPLMVMAKSYEEGSLEDENLSDLDEENHGMKLRDEPSYKKYKYLIFPDDSFKEKWDFILAVFILYSCLWVPYFMAFEDSQSTFTIVIDALSDIIFMIDIAVNFNLAFYNSQDVLIVKRSKIAIAYIKFWFWLDIVSALPLSLIIEYENTDKNLKFQRLFKLTRLIRIFKMIKERNRILKYLNSVLKMTAGGAENIFAPIIVMACFCHVSACFYYMLSASEDDPTTWMNAYQDKDSNEKYLTAFYWVTQTVVTTGYGDIPCVTSFERMFAICLMFIGVLVYSFCVGSLSNFLIALDDHNEHFNSKLVTLYSMKHQYNLDFFLCKKIERHLRYGKITQIREQQKEFVLELPKNLKIELSAIIYKNLIDGVEFFKNKPKRFMAFICPYLKSIKFKQEDIVADEGDRANEIYFLKSGSVAVVLKQYSNFKVMKIAEGYYFGEVDVLFSNVRSYTFMAETDCELLCMSKPDFMKVFFKEFKSIGAELYRSAVKKRSQMKEASEKAKNYCHHKKMTILLRKNTTILDLPLKENSENNFYRKSSIMSQKAKSLSLIKNSLISNANDPKPSSMSDSESDTGNEQDQAASPEEEKQDEGDHNLIKLHKVELDSLSQTSEKKAMNFEKTLEMMDSFHKIDERLDNIENFINDFIARYDREDRESNLSEQKEPEEEDNALSPFGNKRTETLSEGEGKHRRNSLSEKRKIQKDHKTSHFFFKNKEF